MPFLFDVCDDAVDVVLDVVISEVRLAYQILNKSSNLFFCVLVKMTNFFQKLSPR
jgi:hypothetical protein